RPGARRAAPRARAAPARAAADRRGPRDRIEHRRAGGHRAVGAPPRRLHPLEHAGRGAALPARGATMTALRTTLAPALGSVVGPAARRVLELRWTVLPPATGVAVFALILGAVLAAPREIIEGEVQRLMYIHVPSAISAYLAFTITFVASLAVLWTKD